MDRVEALNPPPEVHVIGHIHHAYGVTCNGPTLFINAACMDEDYKLTHAPVAFELAAKDAEPEPT